MCQTLGLCIKQCKHVFLLIQWHPSQQYYQFSSHCLAEPALCVLRGDWMHC